MPLEPQMLAVHMEQYGPFLYHVTDARHEPAIVRCGLRPGSELNRYVRSDFFRTRRAHVYIGDGRRVAPLVEVAGDRLVLQVDLRLLDLAGFDTDEDVPYQQARFQADPWFDVRPPERQLDEHGAETPGQAGRLATWAESIPEFDDPPFVARSLAAGRVAYRGTISPSALTPVLLRSEVVKTFASRACELLHVDDLGPLPVSGSSDVELGRARAIAQALLDAVLSATTELAVIEDTDLSKPLVAHYLEGRIRNFGYERNRMGDEAMRDTAFALANLLKSVDELEATLGWDPDACLGVAQPAASLLPLIEARRGREAALRVADGAITAAA